MRLILEQKQTMKMTNELRQAIELLQFSTAELFDFVQEKIVENPFIDAVESPTQRGSYDGTTKLSTHDVIAQTATIEHDLYSYLLEQLSHYTLTKTERRIVEYIVFCLDEDGYLKVNQTDIIHDLQITMTQFQHAKRLVQQLEPIGVGATSASECLLLQAKYYEPNDVLLHQMIEYHLENIAFRQIERIAYALNISESKVQEKIQVIQTKLHPKPASHFKNKPTHFIEPDIIVTYDHQKGEFTIHLTDSLLPKMTFNDDYKIGAEHSREISTYIKTYRTKFDWLMKSLEKRRITMLQIMNVILQKQKIALQKGLHTLKPLTLKNVAEKINMHESTVSRATANKFIQTPVGTFELKKLFSSAIQMSNGESISTETVKDIIKELIETEQREKPLSDQNICNSIQEKGIVISRRTVTKYREQLRILSSTKRKMEYSNKAGYGK